jgi:putative ABC transport system permease protein
MLSSVRLAARNLLRSPGFALTATMTLALGIGLSTAVFTVADALLIRRLPVGNQERVVVLWGETRDGRFSNYPLSLSDAREFVRNSRALEGAAFFTYYGAVPAPIRDNDRVYRLRRALVSGNFFEVLKSAPAVGRALRPDDDVVGAAPVVVLSHRAWRQQFGGDSGVIGRAIVMHATGVSHTIVGVMPQGLDYPRGADFWAPLEPNSTGPDSMNVAWPSLDVLGRLRAGAWPADARAELTGYFARPDARALDRDVHGVATPLATLVLGDTKPAVLLLAAATALLLLLTCINVANLLLVRGLGRVREFVVRSALGAARGRLVGQLLTESAILAVAGGAAGVALAMAAVRAFVTIAPSGLPRLDEIGVDVTALVAATAITGAAVLLFALMPAFITSRVELQDVLRSGSRQSGGGRGLRAVTESLVVGQIALAVAVLFAAGLIGRSLIKLQSVDLAFEPKHVLIAELALRLDHYDAGKKERPLIDAVLERVAALPEVEAVTPVLSVPYAGTGAGITGRLSTPEQSREVAATNPMVNMEVIAPNYFTTLGIPVVRGRGFTDGDREGVVPVVVVSESAARALWPGADPLGKMLKGGASPEARLTVIGVVPDTRYRDLKTAWASVYFPLRQSFFGVAPFTLVVRTKGPPASAVPALRRAIAELDAGVALATAAPFETLLAQPRAQPRLNAALLAIFAAAAVVLAAVGLFGVIATMVRQRTRELGIRMALGATGAAVQQMVMVRGLSLAVTGAAVGIGGSLLMSRLLSSLLFDVSPWDTPTIGVVATFMLVVAAVASFIPARASVRIDPAIALRSDG